MSKTREYIRSIIFFLLICSLDPVQLIWNDRAYQGRYVRSELLSANQCWMLTVALLCWCFHIPDPGSQLVSSGGAQQRWGVTSKPLRDSALTVLWIGEGGYCCQRLHCLIGQHGFTCSAWLPLWVWTKAQSELNCPGRCGWGLLEQVKV